MNPEVQLDAPQGSEAWRQDRVGKITSSEMEVLLVNGRCSFGDGFGKGAETYFYSRLAEKLTGKPRPEVETAATEWGHAYEPSAVAVYEALTGCECREVGFIDHPTEPGIGGSPDRLIGDDGGLEVKCPYNPGIHLQYLFADVLPKEHVCQVQSNLWITGRKWWDFVSYYPFSHDVNLSLFRVGVQRDEEYIKKLAARAVAFRDRLERTFDQLMEGIE